MMNLTLNQWQYCYGKPDVTALIRCQPQDFIVEEQLNFSPSGAGEHLLLQVEKIGQNTQFVARELARLTGLRVRDISYAGLKDRHAITRQWFCFKWPIKQDLAWQEWQIEGVQILQCLRHSRKLRLGALKRNLFQIRLRQVSDVPALLTRVQLVAKGVPNYYGEQRFGRDGGNLQLAEQLFSGGSIADRQIRGLALSASRSWLFNTIVSARLQAGTFMQILPGDVLQLDGSGSVFAVEQPDATLNGRLLDADLHLTAPLVGSGKALSTALAAELEQQAILPWQHWQHGLIELRVQAARRSMRLIPQQLTAEQQGNEVSLQFALPAGCFATSVLRELALYQDSSRHLALME
ncbi:tRNA pseudouridine(13) synthase TruD [Arsukibacterium sp.]|uniref:tRNA pseudouridine(13) synthase TruD n=1 Tax=Arsukibacterium sp. TaxID=1977258 RepID=UPI002FDABCDC